MKLNKYLIFLDFEKVGFSLKRCIFFFVIQGSCQQLGKRLQEKIGSDRIAMGDAVMRIYQSADKTKACEFNWENILYNSLHGWESFLIQNVKIHAI